MTDWQPRAAALVEMITRSGELRTPLWQQAFRVVPRHCFVPVYYTCDEDGSWRAHTDGQTGWLDGVYDDRTLITALAEDHGPYGVQQIPVSSSTTPALMTQMLEELDITPGMRVLEIGTGSGYNAALLCERLGSQQVTSIDIDSELVDLARERLAANGYTPTLATTDGHTAYPAGAPYDRIIATCAVPAIPPAWLEQAALGAVILTDVHGPLGGTLVRLRVDDQNSATGRFLPHWAGFMTMRHDAEPSHPRWPVLDLPATQPAVFLLARDGSRAEAGTTPTEHGYPVRQYGPQRLWDRVEQAATFWNNHGRPSYEHFGLTATTTRQYIWYDQPDGSHRWPPPRAEHLSPAGSDLP